MRTSSLAALVPLTLLLLSPALSAAPFTLTQWTAAAGGNNHFYYVFERDDFINWTDASLAAQSFGGYLATITSAEENAFVTALTQTPSGPLESWIGFTDALLEGDFQWVTGETVNYSNWAVGEPNDDPRFAGEDYAIINPPPEPAGTWNDLPNDPNRVRAFVIEFEQVPSDIPEPATFWTLTAAAGALLLFTRRRRRVV